MTYIFRSSLRRELCKPRVGSHIPVTPLGLTDGMTAIHVNAAVLRLALAQANTFAFAQAVEVGATAPMIARRLRSGQWRRELPGVYALAGTERTYEQQLWVAVLAAGRRATVSFEASAAVHGFLGYPRGPLVVTVAHSGCARLPGITVHQITDLSDEGRIAIKGLPITTPARTFVDLAAVSRRIRLRMAIDDARSAGKVRLDEIASALGGVARPGKPGVRLLGSVLDELGPGSIPAASVLEQRLYDSVEQAGLPPLVRQFAFPGRQVVHGCVDGAWPDAMLIVEADSRRWHTRVQDLSRDHLRDQEAARAGWLVLRVMHEHLVGATAETIDTLRATRAIRLRQVA